MIFNQTIASSGGGSTPTGTIEITANGTYDVAQYASADVDVQSGEQDPPNDGKTHIFIEVPADGFTYAPLLTRVSGTMSIDWGDGTTQTATASNPTHTYSSAGEYEVTMKVTGMWHVANGGFGANSQTWLTNISTEVTQTNAKRALSVRRAYLFDSSLVLNYSNSFRTCINMTVLDISGVNNTTQTYHAGYCYSLKRAVLPAAATMVPNYSFYYCASLVSVEIPSTVTSIGNSVFNSCLSLQTITIPSAVESIGTSAFGNCNSMKSIHFLPTTPPTVANANAWTNLPTTCTIHVPSGTLADYTAATNYPDPATYTYVED